MSRPLLAVFDLAGTTVHDPDGVVGCLMGALEASGNHRPYDEVLQVMGIRKDHAIRNLLPVAPIEEVLAIHEDFRLRMMEYYRSEPGVREIEGTSELFATLREAGVRVATDTGFDRETVDVLFDRLGWRNQIDDSITSDEVANGRPAPDMIHELMRRAGVSDPARVAKIGDAPADMQEGTNAGCGWIIGVTHGTHTDEQLRAHPHTHIAHSMNDIQAILLG